MKKINKFLLSLSALVVATAATALGVVLFNVSAEEPTLGEKIASIQGLNATYDSTYEEASSGINTSVMPTVRAGGNKYVVFQYDLIEGESTTAYGRIAYDFGNTPYGNGLLYVPAYNVDVYSNAEGAMGSGLVYKGSTTEVSPLITSANEGKTITVVVSRETLAMTMYVTDIGETLTYDNTSGFTISNATGTSVGCGTAACYWSTGSAMTQTGAFATAQTVSKWSKMGGLFVGDGKATMENIKVFDENGNDLGLMLGNDYVVSNLSAPEGYLTTFSSADIGHTAPINSHYQFSANHGVETAFTPLNDTANTVNRTMLYSAGDSVMTETVFPSTYNTSLSTRGQALGLYFANGNYKTQFNFGTKVKISSLESITVRVWSDTMYYGATGAGSIQFFNSKNETVTANVNSVNLNKYLPETVTSESPLTDYVDITIPASDLAVLADEDGYLSGVQVLRVSPSKAGWCVFDEISYELLKRNELGEKIEGIQGLNATYDNTYEEASSGINTSVMPTVRAGGNKYVVFQYDLIEGESATAYGRIEYDFGNTPYGNGLLRVPAYNVDVYSNAEGAMGSGLVFKDSTTEVSPFLTAANEGKTITVVVSRETLAMTMYVTDIGEILMYDNTSGFTISNATGTSVGCASAACYWSTGSAMNSNAVFGTAQTVSKWSTMGGLFVGNGKATMENIKVFDENGNDLGLMLGNDYVVSNLSAPEGYLTTFSSADIGHTAPINSHYQLSANHGVETAFTPLNDTANTVNRTMLYSAGDSVMTETVFPSTYNTSLSTRGQALGLYFANGNYKTQFNFGTKVKLDEIKSITVRVWSDTMYYGATGGGSIQFYNSKNETVIANVNSVNLNKYLPETVTSASPLTDYADIKIPARDLAVLADEDGYLSGVQVLRVSPSKAGWCVFDEISYELKDELDIPITMEKGASVRLSIPTGLGFTTQVDYSAYNSVVAKYGEENIATGTLILPTDTLPSGAFTKDNLDANNVIYLDVKNQGFLNLATAETDGYYAWRGSIVGIKEQNLRRDFSAIGYIKVTIDGIDNYIYATQNENSRNIVYVATQAYTDVSDTKSEELGYIYQITDESHPNYGAYSRYSSSGLEVLSSYLEIEDIPQTWLTYNGSLETVSYDASTGLWTITGVSSQNVPLVLCEEIIDYYKGVEDINALTISFGWKDNVPITMYYKFPNDEAMIGSNAPVTRTISLKDITGDLEMIFFYVDRTWSGDVGGATGFTVKITPCMQYDEADKATWISSNGEYDGIELVSVTENGYHYATKDVVYDYKLVYKVYSATNEVLKLDAGLISDLAELGVTEVYYGFGNGNVATYFNISGNPAFNSINTSVFTLTFTDAMKTSGKSWTVYHNSNIAGTAVEYYHFYLYYNLPEESEVAPYVVYATDASSTEKNTASTVADWMSQATGKTISAITDAQYASKQEQFGIYHAISLGNTTLAESAGVSVSESDVLGDGYISRIIDGNLYIQGLTERGTLYGALDWLEDVYGVVMIDFQCSEVAAGQEISLGAENWTTKNFTPTFDTRAYASYSTYGNYTNALSVIYQKNNSYWALDSNVASWGGTNTFGYIDEIDHNMYNTLVYGVALYNETYGTNYVASDYAVGYDITLDGIADNYNPCLTSGLDSTIGAYDFMYLAMKTLILTQYPNGVTQYSLSQEDTAIYSDDSEHRGLCHCASCETALATYGGRSGILLNFCNTLLNDLLADEDIVSIGATDIQLKTSAYQYTIVAPTVANSVIKAHDKLIIQLAFPNANALVGLTEDVNKKYLESWSSFAGASGLHYWGYDVNYANYIEYFPSITGAMADNVYALKQAGVTSVMYLGAYNSSGIWHSDLRGWVYSKMLYNFDEAAYSVDADAYVQSLVTEYLNAYYGDYADAVQNVIDYYQNAYASANATIIMSGDYSSLLTKAQHETAAAYLDDAIAAAVNDETMLQRLNAVKASCLAPIAYRYSTFVGECPEPMSPALSSNDEDWRDDAIAWYTSFFDLCEAGNISHFAETVTLTAAETERLNWVQSEYENAQ